MPFSRFASTDNAKKAGACVAIVSGIIVALRPWVDIPAFIKAAITSEERAIKFYRDQVFEAVGAAAAIFGTGVFIYEFSTIAPRQYAWLMLHFPALMEFIKNLLKLNQLDRRAFIYALYGVAGRIFLRKSWDGIIQMWRSHITKNYPLPDAKPFFGSKVILNHNKTRWIPAGMDVDFVIARSMSYYGMGISNYLFTQFTVGLEYPFNVTWRVFCRYAKVGRFAVSHTTPENFYQGVINTSMACYMNDKGNLHFTNLALNFNETSVLHIREITIDLDHDKKIFKRMTLDGETIHDSEQAAIVAMNIFAIYTHPHVHWWANGATQLIGKWKLAQTSSDITQWMNNAATYKSWYFIGDSAAVMASIIYNNMNQGLPVHSKMPAQAALNSRAHQINAECRREILKIHPEWEDGHIDSLMASTVLHSSDHFYTDKYMSFASQSEVLRHDFSYIRVALFGPNTYYTRRLLCRQRQDDPIAKLIYTIAAKWDKDFADKGLFFACAN